MCVREREENFFARGKGSVFEQTNTTCDKEKKSARSKKVSSSSEGGENGVSIPTFAPTGGCADLSLLFPPFFLSLSLDGGKRTRRSRRARRGVIGSLGSRTPPVVRRKGKEERPFFEMGGARSFKPNTPTGLQIESERLRRESERADDVNDDAPSSCTRSTDSPRFFCGLLDCSSRVRFAFAFVSSSRCAPRPPRRRRLRCERFEAALPFERSSWSSSRVLLHRLRIYSSVREGESRP